MIMPTLFPDSFRSGYDVSAYLSVILPPARPLAMLILGTPTRFCPIDRKSTRLNSSHLGISYAVFCLKKKIDTPSLLLIYVRRAYPAVPSHLPAPQPGPFFVTTAAAAAAPGPESSSRVSAFFFLMIRRPPRSTLFPPRRSSDLPRYDEHRRQAGSEQAGPEQTRSEQVIDSRRGPRDPAAVVAAGIHYSRRLSWAIHFSPLRGNGEQRLGWTYGGWRQSSTRPVLNLG